MAAIHSELRDAGGQLKDTIPEATGLEKFKKELDISNFEPNAVIRGAQLTLVGAHRALQNPAIFTNDHYKQAAAAVVVGICIRLAIMIPVSAPWLGIHHYSESLLLD
jgi:hypothetical protein